MLWLLVLSLVLIIIGFSLAITILFGYYYLSWNFKLDYILVIIGVVIFVVGIIMFIISFPITTSEEESSIPEVVETASPDYDKDTHYYIIAEQYTDTEYQYSLYEIEIDDK